jgi:hypothetical protein
LVQRIILLTCEQSHLVINCSELIKGLGLIYAVTEEIGYGRARDIASQESERTKGLCSTRIEEDLRKE